MVSTAFGDLAKIGGGMIMNVIYIIGALLLMAALYYITRWFQKNSKKQKAFTINADILDMNGVIEFDKMAFMKSEFTGMLEMCFQTRKGDTIPPIPKHLIKAGRVTLLNYAPGHYAVIDTAKTIRNYEAGINKVVLFNLGMKKYLLSKQRAIMNKAEQRKKNWDTWGPWVTLFGTAFGAFLLCAFLFWLGVTIDSNNIAERTKECLAIGWKP